jgi:hypothetical protein
MTDKKSDGSTTGERVGYRNPPKSGQFVKGKSGNPKGRPRRPKTLGTKTAADNEYDAMFLEEMNRQVSVREGDTVEKMPLERASHRAIMLKAAKGDVKAFAAMNAKREAIENRRRAHREEMWNMALAYKAEATQELIRRRAMGASGPEIIPHPDDIEINPKTGAIVFNGPVSLDQKMAQDSFLSCGPALEREWRKSPGFISKDPWHLREHAKLKRRLEIVGRLVAKRSSTTNSWDTATLEEKIDFLVRLLLEPLSKYHPIALARSRLFIKLFCRDWLGIEPTDAERQACFLEISEVFAAA